MKRVYTNMVAWYDNEQERERVKCNEIQGDQTKTAVSVLSKLSIIYVEFVQPCQNMLNLFMLLVFFLF